MVRQDRSLFIGCAAALVLGCGNGGDARGDASDSATATITVTVTASGTGGSGTDSDTDGMGTEGGTDGMACMATAQCAAAEVCANEVCVPSDGPCALDADCTGDTHCCAEGCLPPGETDGQCIPYNPGDVNDLCLGDVAIGLFEPNVQCEWVAPDPADPFPGHANVLTTPLVADLPNDSGVAGEIVIVTYNGSDGGSESGHGSDPAFYGLIRVLNGQTCEVLENIDDPANRVVAATPPAIADLDGDGNPEIVTLRAITGVVAFTWNAGLGAYETMWSTTTSDISGANRWDGPAIHDLDNDGFPEVISGSEVYDGLTGARLNAGQVIANAGSMVFSVVGDLDRDGAVELVADDIYRWNSAMNRWEFAYMGGPAGARHYGFADFGTPGATPADFDPMTFDGEAEVVYVAGGTVQLYTLDGQLLLAAAGVQGGGPPTIGDFDNDGRPEIASAGGQFYRVFDLDCDNPMNPGCSGTAAYVRWIQPSQDSSSQNTGSSIFDFEGDGQAEAVYGDECYVRVYEGATGEVLYSAARTSCTWYENPVVADPDRDDNTEILIGSNTNCSIGCPAIDPIDRGVRCEENDDCLSTTCVDGFCRCTTDVECNAGTECQPPPPGTPPGGNTCRAAHPPGIALSGVRVLRDRLDRWASSRPLWNQHAYSITNVNDDLSVPATAAWTQNFSDPMVNNYRQNRQGDSAAGELPDITGKLDPTACTADDLGMDITLTGTVCNRGLKAVGAALPATFYLGDPADGNVLCVAFTAEPVPVGECREVSCPIGATFNGTVTMVVNDDGMGGRITLECIETNNTDVVVVAECVPPG